MQRASMASVAVALTLAGLKIYAVVQTGALSVLGSLLDTLLDVIASLVTLFAVRVATQPADEDHRFGHGKAEAIAALFQTSLIIGSGLALILAAGNRLLHPHAVTAPDVGIWVSLVAIVATLALVAYQRQVVRMTGSLAVDTDRLHYESDLALNCAVIAALALESWFRFTGADAAFGLGIAAYLIWGAQKSARRAIDMLMDREWDEARRTQIVAAVTAHPDVRGIHELRTRTSGLDSFVQFHIWLDPELPVKRAHRIVDEVEGRVRALFPDVEVLIHVDPAGIIEQGERDPDHQLLDPMSAASRLRSPG